LKAEILRTHVFEVDIDEGSDWERER